MTESSLWHAADRSRWFLVPRGVTLPEGDLAIRTLMGDPATVDAQGLVPYEITEEQARRWARDQLGRTLEELKRGIDEKLSELRHKVEDIKRRPVKEGTTITPEAPSALGSLLKQLPSVIGHSLSGDEALVESARKSMVDLQQRLKESGIDLDDRFTRFPDRLAELRSEAEEKKEEGPPKQSKDSV
jgi:hypothetical protein